MKTGSQEYLDAMEFFERCVNKEVYGLRFQRTPRDDWKLGKHRGPYECAKTSELFWVFLHGIEYARSRARLGDLSLAG